MRRPEEQLQLAVAQFLRLAAPDLLWWAVPNQRGTRSLIENAILKRLGVRPGVPDIGMILPGGVAGFIELKAPKGRLTETQVEFAQAVQGRGGRWLLCRSIEDVRAALVGWNVPLRIAA